MEIQLNNKTLFKFSFTYDISKNTVTVNGDVLSQGDISPQGAKQDTEDITQESQVTKDELVDISKVDLEEYCNKCGNTLLIYLMLSGKTWGIAPYEDTTGYSDKKYVESLMNRTMIAKPVIRNECFTKDFDNIVSHIEDTSIKFIDFIFVTYNKSDYCCCQLKNTEIESSKEFMNRLISKLDEMPLSLKYKSKPILK